MVMRQKFNKCLEKIIATERYMYIMTLEQFNNHKETWHLFNNQYELNSDGLDAFWLEINSQMRKFEMNEIHLKPVLVQKKKNKKKIGKQKPQEQATQPNFDSAADHHEQHGNKDKAEYCDYQPRFPLPNPDKYHRR